METPLEIQGVGNGTQRCEFKAILPITLPRSCGSYSLSKYQAPIIPDSAVPGLLGLRSMMKQRVVIDTANKKLIMCGEGPVEIRAPPGSETFQLEQAPSGHLLLPISEFDALRRYEANRNRLDPKPESINLPVVASSSASSSSGGSGARGLPRNPGTPQ